MKDLWLRQWHVADDDLVAISLAVLRQQGSRGCNENKWGKPNMRSTLTNIHVSVEKEKQWTHKQRKVKTITIATSNVWLHFVLFPSYNSYHRLCCVTLITSNAFQIPKGDCCVLKTLHMSYLILIPSLIKRYVVRKVHVNFTPITSRNMWKSRLCLCWC